MSHRPVGLGDVIPYVNPRGRVPGRVPEHDGYRVDGDVYLGGEGGDRVPAPIGAYVLERAVPEHLAPLSERASDGLESPVHVQEVVLVTRIPLHHVEKVLSPLVASDYLPSLGLYLDRVEPVRLLSPVLEPPVLDVGLPRLEEVGGVDA